MKILTFEATEPDTHGGQGLALILNGGQVHPVVIRGSTAEAAGDAAARWWEEELAGAKGKKVRADRKAAGKAPPPAPALAATLAPVIDDEECV